MSSVAGARSVLFCATDEQVYEYARALRETQRPLAPYYSPSCKPGRLANHAADDLECAERVYKKTLELVGLPDDYLDRALGNRTFARQVG